MSTVDYHKHLIIPDCQVKPGVPLDHLNWIGQYIVEKQPDVIVNLGDFADMHSLNSYDVGTKKEFHSRRYVEDIAAANYAMKVLMQPLHDYNHSQIVQKKKRYKPKLHLLLGNHEHRIERAINADPVRLDGIISTNDLRYEDYGWNVVPYLDIVEIDGINYSHFFPRGPNGKVMQNKRGAPNAKAQVQREMQSCTSGHMQGLDYYIYQTHNRRYHGLIAGSCYMHGEDYLSPQGTKYWRGVVVKHEVHDGEYDVMTVSLDYLCRRYEGVTLDEFMKENKSRWHHLAQSND